MKKQLSITAAILYDEVQYIDPEEAAYRLPLTVQKILVFPNGDSYPVCPKCDVTLEREYMNFCDRCGQKLDWKEFGRAEVVRIK